MGLFDEWVAVRGADAAAVGARGAQVLGERGGWLWARSHDLPQELASEFAAPAIAGRVADSDFGWLGAAAPTASGSS